MNIRPRSHIKKVLLVWPYIERAPVTDIRTQQMLVSLRFPLGIGYLAAYLERELNLSVEILDMVAESPERKRVDGKDRWGLSDAEIESAIKRSGADLVGPRYWAGGFGGYFRFLSGSRQETGNRASVSSTSSRNKRRAFDRMVCDRRKQSISDDVKPRHFGDRLDLAIQVAVGPRDNWALTQSTTF